MTIEEKAKAYDEALERAIKILDEILNNELIGFPDQIREIFPELRESDDERIRKALIKLFQECDTDIEFCNTGFTYQEVLDWLEKQKVQKEINLVEILKHYPKETELYSPLYGKLWLAEVDETNEIITCYKRPLEKDDVRATLEQEDTVSFYSNGTTGLPDFEVSKDCMLFLYNNEKQKEQKSLPLYFSVEDVETIKTALRESGLEFASNQKVYDKLEKIPDSAYYLSTVGRSKLYPDGTVARHTIGYIEKQKDANKAIEAVDRIDKYIDEHLANAHDMKDSNPDKKYYRGWDDALSKMAGILQDVYSGEKQKEQPKEELVYRLNGLMQEYIKEGKDEAEKEHRFKCYQLFWDALEDTSYFEQKEQKPIEDVTKDITENKEAATKFLKSAGIMDENGELAEMYRSEQKSADYNYDNRIQYDSIKSGVEAFASTYSFNIESKLFLQLTKEQQQLWREEIEQAVVAGGENGIELARDNRYKENRMVEWSEEEKEVLDSIIDDYEKANKSFCGYDGKIGLLRAIRDGEYDLPKQEWSEDYREEDIQTRFAFYTYKDDPSVLYLSNVFVEQTSRNRGFGTCILKAAEKVAEAIGAIKICLKVKQDSPANAWYRKRGYGYVAFEDGYDWLEKNLEYLKPDKSAEWNEEDEKILHAIELHVGQLDSGETINGFSSSDMLRVLKSLRPQPHWKPTEEQMKELRYASAIMKCNSNDIAFPALIPLCDQLEKLM